MLFAVSVVAIVGGFGNYFVRIMIGADDMTFPKLNGVSWWFVLPGVIAVLLSPLMGGIQTGWTAYAPLAAMDAPGQDLYYVGVSMLGLVAADGHQRHRDDALHARAGPERSGASRSSSGRCSSPGSGI